MTAFHCQKCPRHANLDGGGCPAWWQVLERNDKTNEERVEEGCGWVMMPRWLTEVMRFAHRAAACSIQAREDVLAKVEEVRNESLTIAGGLFHIPGFPGTPHSRGIRGIPQRSGGLESVVEVSGGVREREPGDIGSDERPANEHEPLGPSE